MGLLIFNTIFLKFKDQLEANMKEKIGEGVEIWDFYETSVISQVSALVLSGVEDNLDLIFHQNPKNYLQIIQLYQSTSPFRDSLNVPPSLLQSTLLDSEKLSSTPLQDTKSILRRIKEKKDEMIETLVDQSSLEEEDDNLLGQDEESKEQEVVGRKEKRVVGGINEEEETEYKFNKKSGSIASIVQIETTNAITPSPTKSSGNDEDDQGVKKPPLLLNKTTAQQIEESLPSYFQCKNWSLLYWFPQCFSIKIYLMLFLVWIFMDLLLPLCWLILEISSPF